MFKLDLGSAYCMCSVCKSNQKILVKIGGKKKRKSFQVYFRLVENVIYGFKLIFYEPIFHHAMLNWQAKCLGDAEHFIFLEDSLVSHVMMALTIANLLPTALSF